MAHSMAGDGDGLPALTLNSDIDPAEPRVRDLDLAERLGMANPRSIRELIEANRAELESYGILSAAPTKSPNPQRRGRPGREYWLNEGQALVICILSRTERAPAVRRLVITTYQAARAGRLGADPAAGPIAALPPPEEPPFCRGCHARLMWENPSLPRGREWHPLAGGPISRHELTQLVVFRYAVAEATKAAVDQAVAQALDAVVSAARKATTGQGRER